MNEELMKYIFIGSYIGSVIGHCAFWALFGAFILQLVCKMVVKFKPPYGMAYRASFYSFSVVIVVIPLGWLAYNIPNLPFPSSGVEAAFFLLVLPLSTFFTIIGVIPLYGISNLPFPSLGIDAEAVLVFLGLPLFFFIPAAIYASLIKYPQTDTRIGLGRACLVHLISGTFWVCSFRYLVWYLI